MRDKEETSLVPRPSGELARIPPGPRAIHDSMVNDATEIIRAREAISLSEAEATAWNEAAITELKDQDLRAIALAAKARLEGVMHLWIGGLCWGDGTERVSERCE